MNGSHKIGAQHLSRPAVVYVRQSTLDQVRHHHESRRRQYQLAERARGLGWKEVSVIDEDLGKSGASSLKRTGFQRLVAEVGLGRIGAVLSIEVSRLARNNRDWYHLLDLCGLMDTIIVDDEGIYDVRQPNDRLLLGLKGTLSEAELSWCQRIDVMQLQVPVRAPVEELFHRARIGGARVAVTDAGGEEFDETAAGTFATAADDGW
jgi:hypothetical protein